MTRQPYAPRSILLRTAAQVELLCRLIPNLPLDADKPLEVLIREQVKARKPEQGSLMWAGPLKDIAAQAYVQGRTYSDTVWHEYLKAQYLPEEYDPRLCKNETYRKWDYAPDGTRVLVGSTTELTIAGFSEYLEQVYAYGSSLGVMFTENSQRKKP